MIDRAERACAEGVAAQQRGDIAAALVAFGHAVAQAPARLDLRLVQAYALAASGDRAAAAAVLDATPDIERLTERAARQLTDAALPIHADHAAECALRVALRTAPHDASLHAALGAIAERRDRIDEAADHLSTALRLDAHYAPALVTRARVEAITGQWLVARATLDDAVAIDPTNANARYQRGLVQLTLGDFSTGWHDAEARRALRWHQQAAPAQLPPWDGSSTAVPSLLVWGEQGLGDQLQFARFVPLLAQRTGVPVTLHVAPALCTLLSSRLPSIHVAALGSPAPVGAHHVPLMSLPALLGITTASQFGAAPYLAGAACVRRIPALPPRIGLCWAGNPAHARDRERSIPADALPTLLNAVAAEWVSLQVGGINALRASHPTVAAQLTDGVPDVADFLDTAHRMATLDAVVTADTSVAHLAGALGIPTWILIPPLPDWRWQVEAERSPWYGSATLVRRHRREQWRDVLPRVATQLASYFRTLGTVAA